MDIQKFPNINEAWSFILEKEKNKIQQSEFRKKPTKIMNFQGQIESGGLDDPGVSFHNNAPKDGFIVNRLFSGRFSLKPNLKHRAFLFRGQSEFYPTCTPSMFRNKDKTYFIDDNLLYQEMILLMKSHPLMKLFDSGILLNGRKFVFEMNYFGLTQHYYNKTSFLDLTSDTDVASFFATTRYDYNTDTYSPITNSDKKGVLYYYELDDETSAFIIDPRTQTHLSTIGLQVFPRSGKQKGFLLNLPKGSDFNKLPKVKYVFFEHDNNISKEIFKKMEGGKQLFPDDILQEHWKKRHAPKLISEKTLDYNYFINYRIPKKVLRQQAINQGFTIGGYDVKFTSSELNKYYIDIENGFWEEFCDKIYFTGKYGDKYKECLLDIPNQPLYKWAFKK